MTSRVRPTLVGDLARSLRTIGASRAVRPIRPDRLVRVALAQRRYGLSPALAVRAGAELDGDRPAIHDEGQGRTRIVLGDWYEQGSVLRVSEDGVDLASL